MATGSQNQLPPINRAWFDPATGLPTKEFALYMLSLDKVFTSVLGITGSLGTTFLLQAGHQNIGGGFTETEFDNGTPANAGSITLDPLNGLKQKVTNNVAGFTINAPTSNGDIELRIINGASAGAITFSGFDKNWTGDPLTTVNAAQFMAFCYGFTAKKAYLIKALQ
jgi:hypothetical protein